MKVLDPGGDVEERARLGKAGRVRAEQRYRIETHRDALIEVFRHAVR